MEPTIMDDLRSIIGPAATSKIARAMLSGEPNVPKLRAAINWSFQQPKNE